jgi:hypothetical protein
VWPGQIHSSERGLLALFHLEQPIWVSATTVRASFSTFFSTTNREHVHADVMTPKMNAG